MNTRTRRRLEMGARALEFSRAHPDDSPGYTGAVAELEQLLVRADQLARQQVDGISAVRAASQRKKNLSRSIRQRQLVHVARAVERASQEMPQLAQKFTLARGYLPYQAFRTLARTIATEAEQHKELLIKHGLVERVLQSLVESLDQFDQAVAQGAEGRRVHIGAGVELDVVADEAVQIVKVHDGLNRFRFADDPDLFRAWQAASNVIGPPRTGGRADGHTVRDATVKW